MAGMTPVFFTLPLLALLALDKLQTSVAQTGLRSGRYTSCPAGLVVGVGEQPARGVRSSRECHVRCMEAGWGCGGLDVCPGEGGAVVCTLTGGSGGSGGSGGCSGLVPGPSFLCRHFYKDTTPADLTTVEATAQETTPVDMTMTTSSPAEVLTTSPSEVMTTSAAEVMTTSPAEVMTTSPVEVMTTSPAEVMTTSPAEVMTTSPVEVMTTSPAEVMTTSPAEVMTTSPAEVMTTSPAEVMTTSPAELSTEAVACDNGGTPVGGACSCPAQYAGRTCSRFIRDCSEAVENGHLDSQMGIFYVHPTSAPAPFLVQCLLTGGGQTKLLRRTNAFSFDRSWAACRAGFGEDLLTLGPAARNFFVGLDNMHHFSQQAAYDVNIFGKWGDANQQDGALYVNLTVGPESESYALRYESYRDNPTKDIENGLSKSLPLKFSASGNDLKGCYGEQGNKGGWYDATCAGNGMFTNGLFYWPVSGQLEELKAMQFIFTRQSPLYGDLDG